MRCLFVEVKSFLTIYIIKLSVLLIILNFFILSSIFSAEKIDDLSFSNTEITEVLKTVIKIFVAGVVQIHIQTIKIKLNKLS